MSFSRSNKEKGKAVVTPPDNLEWDGTQTWQDYDDLPNFTTPTSFIPTNVSSDDDEPSPVPPTQQSTEKAFEKPPKSDVFAKQYTKKTMPDGLLRAFCNYCNKSYAWKKGDGYGTLNRHTKVKHPGEFGIDRTQTQLPNYSSQGGNEVNLFKYSRDAEITEWGNIVCLQKLSFSHAEDPDVVKCFQRMYNPLAERVPRNTLVRGIRKSFYHAKNALKEYMLTLDHSVSICSDIWSDHWLRNDYMGVTCHWINSSWQLEKRVIAFPPMNIGHTAQEIAATITNVLADYFLTTKVFSVSFDNASANTASIATLKSLCRPAFGGKYFHIRCICHILNLCVQDALNMLQSELAPIRALVNYLWAHSNVKKQWCRYCVANGKHAKQFSRDVPTRWNSTYKLLEQTFEYRELLCSFFSTQQQSAGLFVFTQQWDACVAISTLLKIFNDATSFFSGVYYPTSHMVLMHFYNIAKAMVDCEKLDILNACLAPMKAKWLKYFKNIPELYLVATIMDPRGGLDFLRDLLQMYYDALFPVNERETNHCPNVDAIFTSTKISLFNLFDAYSPIYGGTQNTSQVNTSSIASMASSAERLLAERLKRPRSSSLGSNRVELDNYLTTSFEFSSADASSVDFDILKWWKQKSKDFPVLSAIARDLLACPVSTVAVEQTFSASGQVLDPKRSNLSKENLEAQLCLGDWQRAKHRTQHLNEIEEFEDDPYVDSSAPSTAHNSAEESDA